MTPAVLESAVESEPSRPVGARTLLHWDSDRSAQKCKDYDRAHIRNRLRSYLLVETDVRGGVTNARLV